MSLNFLHVHGVRICAMNPSRHSTSQRIRSSRMYLHLLIPQKNSENKELRRPTSRIKCRGHLSSSAGWWFQTLWKILVSWDDYSRYMEKLKKFQTTNQSGFFLIGHPNLHDWGVQARCAGGHGWANYLPIPHFPTILYKSLYLYIHLLSYIYNKPMYIVQIYAQHTWW